MISKKVMLVCAVLGILLLSGCGEKDKKDKTVEKKASGVIKITKNVVKKDTKKVKSKENGGQFYYAYNEEGKSKEAKEIDKYNAQTSKTRTNMDAYLNIRSPYERVRITMMVKQLSKDYVIKCSACHNDYANGVIGPSLLGKDKKFIYQRIIDFKTGKRKNVLMKELVTQMSDKELMHMAQEIATFNKQITKMRMGK